MPLPLVMSGGDVDPDRSVTFYVRNLYADRNDDTCRPRYIRVIIHPDTEHITRLHNWHAHGGGRLSLGDGDSGDAEESFAYLAGGITAVISNRVWDYLQATAA